MLHILKRGIKYFLVNTLMSVVISGSLLLMVEGPAKRPPALIYGVKKKTLTRNDSPVYRRFPPDHAHASGAPPALIG